MIEEKPTLAEEETPAEDGRVVYSRLKADEDEEPSAARGAWARASAAERARVATTLTPLIVGFALLIGLVIGLGFLSGQRVNDVSFRALDRERQLAAKYKHLLTLQVALQKLNNEARARARVEGNRGLMPPLNIPMRNARREVDEALEKFRHLELARAEAGQAFLRDVAGYLEITDSLDRYSLEGFEAFRKVETTLARFIEEAGGEQREIQDDLERSKDEARRSIFTISLLAVLTGTVVAVGTIWEVQRRSRQIRRSLEDVRRERRFSEQMLQGMVSAIAAIDRQDRIISTNAAFLKIFPGAHPGASVHGEFAPPESMKVLAAATASRVRRSTYRNRWKLDVNGEERAFDVYSSPLEIDGEPGQIVTLVDVSEAANAEQDLRRQESLAAVGRAAAQVAHEIKNPLGSIRLGVAMLRDMTDSGEARSTIDLVERGIEHLNKLTLDVTHFSRRKELTVAEVDFHSLIDSSLDLVADRVRERRARVEKIYGDEQLRVEADADQMRQVFVNLLANALDASPDGAPLKVITERAHARRSDTAKRETAGEGAAPEAVPFARVVFADEGQGMDERTRARIFEPFFSTKKRGTGLGLSIAKQIVEQHGGRINVESAPGEGTRFAVELPIKQ